MTTPNDSPAPDRGLLLLDKPTGLTSHSAVRRAARHLGIKKVGHAGTLDPLATGLMLVGLGRSTRLLEYLVGCDKTYIATIRLGESRDTLDREGELIATAEVPDFTVEELEAAFGPLRGTITQTPPAHSAIKVDGVALHKRARRGEEVEVPTREVTVKRLELVSAKLPELVVEVECTSGTYVRSLARDIGKALGVGGSIHELRRTTCGTFKVEDALTMEAIEELGEEARRNLLGPEQMLPGIPTLTLNATELGAIMNGTAIAGPPDLECAEGAELALLSPQEQGGSLVAIARLEAGRIKPRKVVA